MMKRFAASVPRRMYWSKDVGGASRCPECGGPLAGEYHTYLLAVRAHDEEETFLIGSDAGSFCAACPVVVLDSDTFRDFVRLGLDLDLGLDPGHPSASFTVLGLVDLEAVPEEKQAVPLGEEGNPIPLVKFLEHGGSGSGPGPSRQPLSKRKRIRKKKRRR